MRVNANHAIRAACWLAGVAAFAAVLATTDLARATPIVLAAGPWIVLGLLPYLGQISLDALAWKTLLEGLGQRVPWRTLISVRLSTEAVLMSVPGGSLIGESLKPYLLTRATAIPIVDVVASVGVKRALLAAAQALYLGIAVGCGYELLAQHASQIAGTTALPQLMIAAVAVLAIVAIALLLVVISARVADRVHRLLRRIPSRRIRAALDARHASFAATDAAFVELGAQRGRMAGALALLAGAWFVETLETVLLCRLIGIDLSFAQLLAMEATVVLARNLAFFMPAGLGVQDAGYVAFLSAYGLASAASAAFVIVKRTKELVWIGVGYLMLFRLDHRDDTVVSLAAPVGAEIGTTR